MSTAIHREAARVRLALWLLLASLGMMFVTAAIGFVLVRANGNGLIPPLPVKIPDALWVGTLLLGLLSWTLMEAVRAVRRERQAALQKWLLSVWILVTAFFVTQTVGLSQLLTLHRETFVETPVASPAPKMLPLSTEQKGDAARAAMHKPDPRSHGLVFSLVALHAVHVLGGIPALAIVTLRARAGRYDHEWHAGLTYCGMYWHFLGVMWLMFLATFALAG